MGEAKSETEQDGFRNSKAAVHSRNVSVEVKKTLYDSALSPTLIYGRCLQENVKIETSRYEVHVKFL